MNEPSRELTKTNVCQEHLKSLTSKTNFDHINWPHKTSHNAEPVSRAIPLSLVESEFRRMATRDSSGDADDEENLRVLLEALTRSLNFVSTPVQCHESDGHDNNLDSDEDSIVVERRRRARKAEMSMSRQRSHKQS